MQLTADMLTRFAGGQLEIQNPVERYIYRGEIQTAELCANVLTVRFAWLARGEGYPPMPSRWFADERGEYETALDFHSAANIGDGRIMVQLRHSGEIIVFFPRGLPGLDASRVEGLVQPA